MANARQASAPIRRRRSVAQADWEDRNNAYLTAGLRWLRLRLAALAPADEKPGRGQASAAAGDPGRRRARAAPGVVPAAADAARPSPSRRVARSAPDSRPDAQPTTSDEMAAAAAI